MSTMSIGEVRERLAEIPAEEFGRKHHNCIIGHLHRILTGEVSQGFDDNVYPEDVARAVASFNDNLHDARKELAMMMPLPEAFPKLTPERGRRLALWISEKALPHYTGPDRALLESAISLARREAASETYTPAQSAINDRYGTVYALVSSVDFNSYDYTAVAIAYALYDICRAGADGREWLAEYLRIRLEA